MSVLHSAVTAQPIFESQADMYTHRESINTSRSPVSLELRIRPVKIAETTMKVELTILTPQVTRLMTRS